MGVKPFGVKSSVGCGQAPHPGEEPVSHLFARLWMFFPQILMQPSQSFQIKTLVDHLTQQNKFQVHHRSHIKERAHPCVTAWGEGGSPSKARYRLEGGGSLKPQGAPNPTCSTCPVLLPARPTLSREGSTFGPLSGRCDTPASLLGASAPLLRKIRAPRTQALPAPRSWEPEGAGSPDSRWGRGRAGLARCRQAPRRGA